MADDRTLPSDNLAAANEAVDANFSDENVDAVATPCPRYKKLWASLKETAAAGRKSISEHYEKAKNSEEGKAIGTAIDNFHLVTPAWVTGFFTDMTVGKVIDKLKADLDDDKPQAEGAASQ